ncbi:MAG: hypothetical protein RR525_11755 [Cellulosilyticaceae bacterium]
MDRYIDRLEKYFPLYYPNISWQFRDSRLKEVTAKKYGETVRKKVLTYHPNIVFIELGIEGFQNNETTFVSLDTYEKELDELLSKIKTCNNRTGLNGCMPIPIMDLFNTMRQLPNYEMLYLNEAGTGLNAKGEDLLYDLVFITLTRLINYQGVLKDRFVS